MDFGVFLERKTTDDVEEMLEGLVNQTRAARESGFDLVSTGQHFLIEDYEMPQTIPLLSRLAAETGSMAIATGVLLAPFQHPIYIAETIASLDVLADEAIAGIGAGYRDVEFDSFGVAKSERGPRLKESIELLNELWTSKSATYDGEYYSVDDVSISLRPDEKPPVWVAANSRPAVRRAAALGDAWLVNPHATLGEIAEQKAEYDEIRRDRDRDTSVPILRECFVAPTHEEAVEIGETYLAEKYDQYIKWGQDEAMEDSNDLHRSFDALREDRFLLGTPAEVCEQLERMDERINVSHALLRVQWPGLPQERAIECIELLGDDVIPNL